MAPSSYLPILEVKRGEAVESIHYGAIAIVNRHGDLIAWYGNPNASSYLRSTAKPIQALPFIESRGHEAYGFTLQEIAILCASHAGTDDHVAVLNGMHQKIGIAESNLMCGSHPLSHKETAAALASRGEKPTPIRHNCSGKHTGMLAFARYLDLPITNYLDPGHPIQQRILHTFCEICDLQPTEVTIGTDGCSAPNFAAPLKNTALAFARLCDPVDLPSERAAACRTITTAMTSHPTMVAGPGRFDTEIMEVTQGRIVVKGGAEGYLGIGLLPDTKKPTSSALGIAIKISDGDPKGRARPAVALEILYQLGVITSAELETLSHYGPAFPIHNWRKILVGEGKPCFRLNTS